MVTDRDSLFTVRLLFVASSVISSTGFTRPERNTCYNKNKNNKNKWIKIIYSVIITFFLNVIPEFICHLTVLFRPHPFTPISVFANMCYKPTINWANARNFSFWITFSPPFFLFTQLIEPYCYVSLSAQNITSVHLETKKKTFPNSEPSIKTPRYICHPGYGSHKIADSESSSVVNFFN